MVVGLIYLAFNEKVFTFLTGMDYWRLSGQEHFEDLCFLAVAYYLQPRYSPGLHADRTSDC